MDGNRAFLEAIAEALDAASATMRRRAALISASSDEDAQTVEEDGIARARLLHPQLGPRQAQVIEKLQEAWPAGLTTGPLSRSIRYDQANVYLTLQSLVALGFAEKDSTQSPHQYRLGRRLAG